MVLEEEQVVEDAEVIEHRRNYSSRTRNRHQALHECYQIFKECSHKVCPHLSIIWVIVLSGIGTILCCTILGRVGCIGLSSIRSIVLSFIGRICNVKRGAAALVRIRIKIRSISTSTAKQWANGANRAVSIIAIISCTSASISHS